MRYKAVCKDKYCDWKETEYSYICKSTAIFFAETHAMQTGHIVDVVSVSRD